MSIKQVYDHCIDSLSWKQYNNYNRQVTLGMTYPELLLLIKTITKSKKIHALIDSVKE